MSAMCAKSVDSDQYLIEEHSKAIVENAVNNESKEQRIETNGCESVDHYSWCPYFPHQPWCPMIRFQTEFWPQNPSIISMTGMSNSVIANKTSLNLAQKSQRVGQIRPKKTCHHSNAQNADEDQIAKIYSCCLCKDMEEMSDHLVFRKHIEMHLGSDRPFICQVCGKEFKFRSTCRNHMMAHMVVRNLSINSGHCLKESSDDMTLRSELKLHSYQE